jgi:hypothetical protein
LARNDAALLQQTSLFGTMAPEALESLAAKASRRSYTRG